MLQRWFPEEAKIIKVDLRDEQIGRRTRADLGLVCDVGDTIRAMMPS